METDITLGNAATASLSRRHLLTFAAAGSAATLPAAALAEASERTSRLPQLLDVSLDKQLEICVANLKNVLAQIDPSCGDLKHETLLNADGCLGVFYIRPIVVKFGAKP